MSNLVSYAFVTLNEVKEALDISTPDHDARINGYINRATDMVEGYCNRRFISTVYTNEVYTTYGGSELQLRNFPVTVLSSLDYAAGDFAHRDYSAIDTSIYTLETASGLDRGIIYLQGGWFPVTLRFGSFGKGVNNWRVTYTAGYALANIPNDLREAVIEIVSYLFNRRKASPGMKSETLGRYSYQMEDWSRLGPLGLIQRLGVADILDRYRTILI